MKTAALLLLCLTAMFLMALGIFTLFVGVAFP
jgi:hypothetical protein